MRPTIPATCLWDCFVSGLRGFASGILAAAAVLAISFAFYFPASAAQVRSQHERTAPAEMIPAPLPTAACTKDPLAVLMKDEENKEESKGIGQISVDIRPRDVRLGKPAGDMPPNLAASVLSDRMQPLDGNTRRGWPSFCFHWEASGLCHLPLYFEETNLERYGYSPRGLRLFQPVLSAGNFFLTIPLLPYKMAVQPPHEPIYTLGQYRPGSPVPYRIRRPQFRLVGVVAEAAVISGLILLIP